MPTTQMRTTLARSGFVSISNQVFNRSLTLFARWMPSFRIPSRKRIHSIRTAAFTLLPGCVLMLFWSGAARSVWGQEAVQSVSATSTLSEQQPVSAAEESLTVPQTTGTSTAEPEIGDELDSLLDADLQTLRDTRVATPDMNMEVTSVARTEVPVGRTPAAVFVITKDMIRRSGAYSLPDVLRMVPGLFVARSSNGQWSIGVRGTAGIYADTLLVQVDGRSIYTPAFGGVLWQVRDMPLSEIERIEVIRGPGASVWGANAVNGVINIVTRHSRDTLGTQLGGGAGNELKHQADVRYGGRSGRKKTWRIWGRSIEEDGGLLANGSDEPGTWHSSQVGFRMDRETDYFDEHTITGGFTSTGLDSAAVRPSLTPPTFANPVQFEDQQMAGYLMSRRVRDLGGSDSLEIQSFVDITEQDTFDLVSYRLMVADVGFQHHVQAAADHSVIWGANYRLNYVDVLSQSFQLTAPDETHYNLASLFVQDTIALSDDVDLTLGTKFSWNDLTDFELQPTARLVWSPSPKYSFWTSLSRAARLPALLNTDVDFRTPPVALAPLPTFAVEQANPNLRAESLIALEAGARCQPTQDLFWDTSVYYFYTDDTISSALNGTAVVTNPPGFIDLLAPNFNQTHGIHTGGFETFARWSVDEDWSLSGSYSLALTELTNLDRYPRNMVHLQSSHDLSDDLQLDLIWRYTDLVDGANVPAWNEMDLRLNYRVSCCCDVSLIGRNLLDSAHLEDSQISTIRNQTTEVQRGIYGVVRFRY